MGGESCEGAGDLRIWTTGIIEEDVDIGMCRVVRRIFSVCWDEVHSEMSRISSTRSGQAGHNHDETPRINTVACICELERVFYILLHNIMQA